LVRSFSTKHKSTVTINDEASDDMFDQDQKSCESSDLLADDYHINDDCSNDHSKELDCCFHDNPNIDFDDY